MAYSRNGAVELGPGVMAAEAPLQRLPNKIESRNINGYAVSDVAEFELTAKVLAKKNYTFGREADLSPTDLALGWGNMSDERVLQHIDISQSNRFYFWRVNQFPIPRREIETHSANMHLIPGNPLVKRELKRVRKGDLIKISGKLVNAMSTTDNWYWLTSQTRNDTGAGACELVWIDNLYIITP